MKTVTFFCLLSLLTLANAEEMPKHNYKPQGGYVPDEGTAKEIAVAIWGPIYGKAQIAAQKPFHAVLRNEIWTVTGTLSPEKKGGVAIAEIAKDDGRILRVSHGK